MVAVKFWKYSKIYGIEVLGIIMDSKPVDLYSYDYMTVEHSRDLKSELFTKLTSSP